MAAQHLLVVKEAFIANLKGTDVLLAAGDLVEAEHPLVKKYPANFREIVLKFPTEPLIEQATAAPGQKRNVVKRGR